MKKQKHTRLSLEQLLPDQDTASELLGILNLGLVDCLLAGTLTADQAVERFYNAGNCRFVRERLGSRKADDLMQRGVQLPDILTALDVQEAQRELYAELQRMRLLSLELIDGKKSSPAMKASA